MSRLAFLIAFLICIKCTPLNAGINPSQFDVSDCSGAVNANYHLRTTEDTKLQSRAAINNTSLKFYGDGCKNVRDFGTLKVNEGCKQKNWNYSYAEVFYAHCAPDNNFQHNGITYAGTYGTDQNFRANGIYDSYRKAIMNCSADDNCCVNKISKWANREYQSDLDRYDIRSEPLGGAKGNKDYVKEQKKRKDDLIRNALNRSDKTCAGILKELDFTFNRKCACAERCKGQIGLYNVTCALIPEILPPSQCPGFKAESIGSASFYEDDPIFSIYKLSNVNAEDITTKEEEKFNIESVTILPITSQKKEEDQEISTYFEPKSKIKIIGSKREAIGKKINNKNPPQKMQYVKKVFILKHNAKPREINHKIKFMDKELIFTTKIVDNSLCTTYYADDGSAIKSSCFERPGLPKPVDLEGIFSDDNEITGISFNLEGMNSSNKIKLNIGEINDKLGLSVAKLKKSPKHNIIETKTICINPQNPSDYIERPNQNIKYVRSIEENDLIDCPENYIQHESYISDDGDNNVCIVGWQPKPEIITIFDPVNKKYVLAKQLPESFIPYSGPENNKFIDYVNAGPINVDRASESTIESLTQDPYGQYKYNNQIYRYEKEKRFFYIDQSMLEHYPSIAKSREFEGIQKEVKIPELSRNKNKILIASNYVGKDNQNIIFSGEQDMNQKILDPILADLCVTKKSGNRKFIIDNIITHVSALSCQSNQIEVHLVGGGGASGIGTSNSTCSSFSGHSGNYTKATIDIDTNSSHQYMKFQVGKGGKRNGQKGQDSKIFICADAYGKDCSILINPHNIMQSKSANINTQQRNSNLPNNKKRQQTNNVSPENSINNLPAQNSSMVVYGHKISIITNKSRKNGECIDTNESKMIQNNLVEMESIEPFKNLQSESLCAKSNNEETEKCSEDDLASRKWCMTYCNFVNPDNNLGFETCSQYCNINLDRSLGYNTQCITNTTIDNPSEISGCNSSIDGKCQQICAIGTVINIKDDETKWCQMFCDPLKPETYVGNRTCNNAMLNFKRCWKSELYPVPQIPYKCSQSSSMVAISQDNTMSLVPKDPLLIGAGGCISTENKRWQYGSDGMVIIKCTDKN
ncbi:hypothetical protein GUI12_01090 [Anaplasmataceae bacterium AB001_6]|nr:hypothetical protein GUI12_01090 [Anaplasmataceae bacterium AB001_6]